jgi:hypothetical protein
MSGISGTDMLENETPLTDATDDSLEWHSDSGKSDDTKLLLLNDNLCLEVVDVSPT